MTLVLFSVQCGNWGLEAKIAKDEMKYVCPRAAAMANGATDVEKAQRLHATYKGLSRAVWSNG